MARPRLHLTLNDGYWTLKWEGAERASSRHNTKADALEAGRALASKHAGQLIVHLADGRIETEHTYGNDPYPPPG